MDLRNVQKNKKKVMDSAKDKDPKYGGSVPYIDYEMTEQDTSWEDPVAEKNKKSFSQVGIDYTDESRGGSFLYVDNSPSYSESKIKGLEVDTLKDALKKHDWMKNYYWKGIPPTLDMYTAKAYSEDVGGVVIRSKSGYNVTSPMQSCMLISKNKNLQIGHTIIIAEENSSVDVISACRTAPSVSDAFHIEIVEMFAAKNAHIKFTMIHNWDNKSIVRPRGIVHLQEGASFENNYILLRPAYDVQLGPTTFMHGANSQASYQNILTSYKGSKLDVGGTVHMPYPNCTTDLRTKSIAYGGDMILRGSINSGADNQFGNIDCKTLVLGDEAKVEAIPSIHSETKNVEMTHEASIGRLDKNKVDYLRSRGISEERAVDLISSSFLIDASKDLPISIRAQISGWVDNISKYAKN